MSGLTECSRGPVAQAPPELLAADEFTQIRTDRGGCRRVALLRHGRPTSYAVARWSTSLLASTRRIIFRDACSTLCRQLPPMKRPDTGRPRVDGRKRTIVDTFRTVAWYESVTHESPFDTPALLEREFQHSGEGRKRLWERYGKHGRPTPSVSVKGYPGIVAVVGNRYPRTRWVFEHPLWTALDPNLVAHAQTVNTLLLSMHEDAVSNFFDYDVADGESPRRDWWVVENEDLWEYPFEEEPLKLDLLATFLLLFREAKEAGRIETALALGKRVRAQLHDAQTSRELRRFQPKLLEYVVKLFLGPEHEKIDPCVPHAVALDYVYRPSPRKIYRDRGDWPGSNCTTKAATAAVDPPTFSPLVSIETNLPHGLNDATEAAKQFKTRES